MRRVIFLLLVLFFIGCKTPKIKDNKPDSFYTEKNIGHIKIVPLLKPVKLYYDNKINNWYLQIPYEANIQPNLGDKNIDSIGVHKNFIYGTLSRVNYNLDTTNNSNKFEYIYARKDGAIIKSNEKLERNDLMLLKPADSTKLNYVVPYRWFVINMKTKKVNIYFKRDEYTNYTKQKQIVLSIYNPDFFLKKFTKTGTLPWYPKINR